ncbi:HDOD domain-containing protein [Marinobacter sp.]|uniref:HDOD domain-containing protein n=1 Tax=Marinobacter sp. TaxID=50741 RepID=UPI002356B6E2|nr:HDOD domain-containing protein [Marinobacter sp.]
MPGFLSWISSLFSSPQPPTPVLPEARLINPAKEQSNDDNLENGLELTRKLEEHLFCWLLDAKPSALIGESWHASEILGELEHRLSEDQLDELPRQPLSLPMLLRALADESTARQHVTEIILRDPGLTDQLLQVANSPFFRHGDKIIESIDQAVFLLGIDGIRNVVSAAVMRPMMAARNSVEALFAKRVWRWGLSCARASEQIAKFHNADTSAHFMAGLLPALAYITLFRELQRICRAQQNTPPPPALIRQAMTRYQWSTSQLLAKAWNLPPRFSALLLAAERPAPRQDHTPLNDGIIIGTREVLRNANQRNLAEDDLPKVVQLNSQQIKLVRESLLAMLRDEGRSPARL